MKDMFYNYEYHIGQKEYARGPMHKRPEVLDTNQNVEIVRDVFGNEIGIRAHSESKFKLYFFLEECHRCDYDDDFMRILKDGYILFEIIDNHHEVYYSKIVQPNEIIDDTVIIELCSSADNQLRAGFYRLKLSIVDNVKNNKQAIFYEEDSFLDLL